MSLERRLEPSDRLARVEERQTFVILLFVCGTDPDNDLPAHIVGPLTRTECERIEQYLACAYRRERITTQVPTWADGRLASRED
jgi:hypothetical protein